MADTILPQDGATTQTTATPAAGTTPPAQDFQINLAEVTEQSEGIPQGGTPKTEIPEPLAENTQTASNLDLDLNLPEIPKNDDRLKVEDEHNEIAKENITPTTTEPVIQPVVEPIIEPTIPATEPVIEPVAPVAEPVAPVAEPVIEPAAEIKEITTPDTSMNNLPEKNSLENDMKMIESLQGHASAGGLAPEAGKPIQATTIDTQTPKTFDLDAMLGDVATPPAQAPVETVPVAIQQPEINQIPAPAFTLPTPQTQVAVQAVPQVHTPANTLKSVKSLLFVVVFAALGFTTFFILKTMYPLEFANMLGNSDTANHASADITGDIEEITGTVEDFTGDIIETTGNTMEDATFGELNDLETVTSQPEQTDLSRLTDYLNQGNDFLEQGNTMNNNTVIKYGLYISKKATSFLEKIANGEEITNLSGYFAQFDQYIAQLELLVNQTSVEPVVEQEPVSPTPIVSNETPEVTEPTTPAPQNNQFLAE